MKLFIKFKFEFIFILLINLQQRELEWNGQTFALGLILETDKAVIEKNDLKTKSKIEIMNKMETKLKLLTALLKEKKKNLLLALLSGYSVECKNKSDEFVITKKKNEGVKLVLLFNDKIFNETQLPMMPTFDRYVRVGNA